MHWRGMVVPPLYTRMAGEFRDLVASGDYATWVATGGGPRAAARPRRAGRPPGAGGCGARVPSGDYAPWVAAGGGPRPASRPRRAVRPPVSGDGPAAGPR